MAVTVTPVIDRPSRDIAASLIRRFRDGALTNDQFEDDWPRGREDRVLWALSSMLWAFYSDMKEHTLTGKHALTPEGCEFFTRCALFADSDLAYEWPENDFIRTNGTTNGFRWGASVFFLGFVAFAWWLPTVRPFAALSLTVLCIGLVGLVWLSNWQAQRSNERFLADLKASGDWDVWPFIRRSDYDAARSGKSSSPEQI